jgi:hypothetical protein
MNCCNCCTNTIFLGCFDPCGIEFDFDYIIPIGGGGEYQLYLEFGRQYQKFVETFNDGDALIFDLNNLNENYTYSGYLLLPDGTHFIFTDSLGNTYDCFEFMTKIGSQSGINL